MLDTLRAEHAIPGAIAFTSGMHNLPKVVLTHASGASAEVYLDGAHITSWKNARGEELLFVSRESHFEMGRSIRGGIPVVFPQFCEGPLPKHGFARISRWQLARTAVRDTGVVTALFGLQHREATLELWPHPFRLSYQVALDAFTLSVKMRVENIGASPFAYQAVLHTYFGVADIRQTAVHGFKGITYIDSLRENQRAVETRDAIRFAEETDRIYVSAPDRLGVEDEGHSRRITIEKTGMPDAVVWNPWIAKSQQMFDFGDDEYQNMVCVETGIIAEKITLQPGERWTGSTTFKCS
jgi:glucose-6-phosphate 1-epimerase